MEPFSAQTEKPQGMWRSLSHGFNADVEAEGCPLGGPQGRGRSPLEIVPGDFSGDLTNRNGDSTSKNGDLTSKNGDLTNRNGDLTLAKMVINGI